MKTKFDQLAAQCSKMTTQAYSTSFSLGIRFLDKSLHEPIYAIYGFVRFADEIVDSFHGYPKDKLLERFREDTFNAINEGISLNPILNAFQHTVNKYKIEHSSIETFLQSMRMDLEKSNHSHESYQLYILGSAEVVGLMCLRVFTNNNETLYQQLKPAAMKLGSAFQKVNFLRDSKADFEELGRNYFPGVYLANFTQLEKQRIETDIENDFKEALAGIRRLPVASRRGVYLAYFYYSHLFKKIRRASPKHVMTQRIRIPNASKLWLMLHSFLRHELNLLQ